MIFPVKPDALGDQDFLQLSRELLVEMDSLDGAAWQAAQDLREDCHTARVFNSPRARARVADAINARRSKEQP